MSNVFITGIASISPQKTLDPNHFLEEVVEYHDTVISSIDPEYKKFIPPAAARRMPKGIKMGVVAARMAMEEAEVEELDAIITGTGMGCMIDSEKFVSAMINNNEAYLTPTSFIQSTHNTVAGQIALAIGCKAYNFTYVHSAVSFESALLDAMIQIESKEAETILVGGIEELGDHTTLVHRTINHIKEQPVSVASMVSSRTPGAVFSDGANFFVLSTHKSSGCYAAVMAVSIINTLSEDELPQVIEEFVHENGLKIDDIDVVLTGNNGDVEFDSYYHAINNTLFSRIPQVYYKHLVGENNCVSAFGIGLAARIIKSDQVPDVAKLNNINTSKIQTVLCYNQYRGQNHSLVLLRRC